MMLTEMCDILCFGLLIGILSFVLIRIVLQMEAEGARMDIEVDAMYCENEEMRER